MCFDGNIIGTYIFKDWLIKVFGTIQCGNNHGEGSTLCRPQYDILHRLQVEFLGLWIFPSQQC